LHVFTYSERPDTKAISLPGVVDYQERKRRNNILRILSEKKRREFYEELTGTEQEVLFEDADHDGFMLGFTSNYARVKSEYQTDITGKLCGVQIAGVEEDVCKANIISTKKSVDLVTVED
jgi:threonylcarbamoyladenosine tRNA methylthiotransferase MtaB